MVGAVLTGGASRRMGADKALIQVGGTPLAARVARALVAGGCSTAWCVGGDRVALAALGLDVVDDLHPGEGPLGGVLTALEAAAASGAGTLVVAACDMPSLDGASVAAVLAAAGPGGGATPVDDDGRVPLLLALDVPAGLAAARAAFAGGARSMEALRSRLPVERVAGMTAVALRDVDRPADLGGR